MSQTPKLNLMPWVGGMNLWGSSVTKPASGLKVSENFVYDFDGTKRRRGGQLKSFRVPIREGGALDHEFFGRELDTDVWTLSVDSADISLGFEGDSLLHVTTVGTGGSPETIVASLDDSDGTSKVKELVNATAVPSPTATQTQTMRITTRARWGDADGVKAGSAPTVNYTEFKVEPGRGADEWSLTLQFTDSGISVLTSGNSMVDIVTAQVAAGGTNDLGVATSAEYMDNETHTWRFDITRDGSDAYFLAIFLDEVQIFSGIDIRKVTTSTSAMTWTWDPGGALAAIDIEIDNVKVDTTDQKVRGLEEYVVPQEGTPEIRHTALYAGTQIYVDHGDPYTPRSIDAGLAAGHIPDFVVFDGKLIYVTDFRKFRPKTFEFGTERGTTLEGNPPVASMLEVYKNRLWLAGDEDHPSRVTASEVNNFENWNTGSGAVEIEVEKDDGQRVTGMKAYQGNMIVYKERGIYRITGSGVANDFVLTPISRTIGCVAHHTIQNVLNDQYFASEVGVHSLLTTDKFGDLEAAFLSRDIRDYWRENVDWLALRKAWAINNEPLDRYELLVPIYDTSDGLSPNRVLTLHYGLGQEGSPAGLWSVKKITGNSMGMVRRQGDKESRAYVGTTDGHMARQDVERTNVDFPVYAA